MTWTNEQRYKPYAQWSKEDIQTIKQQSKQSPWQTSYHLTSPHGLLNDPNGFSYFNGQYHLFYQHFPFGAVHGLKSWTHTTSDDLVTFVPTGNNIYPDGKYETHGVYSGSAHAINDDLFIFYTGNARDKDWVRQTNQLGGYFKKDGSFERIEHILITQPSDVTEHFRDPQIFKYNNDFFAIVGGQDLDKTGIIKLYKAIENNVENWEYVGNLQFDNDKTAYMMECPNLVFVNDYPVLLYCPQGLNKNVLDYDNIYPNMYKIAQKLDAQNAVLENISDLKQLDYGFETYATQAFNAPNGKVYSISWVGLPDSSYPSDKFHQQGVMSLVKELSIHDGKLYQYPVEALKTLRQNAKPLSSTEKTTNSYELECYITKDSVTQLTLLADENGNGLVITVDLPNQTICVDRTNVGEPFETKFGTTRTAPLDNKDSTLNIFIDNSIFEIFINTGETVLTGRVFPNIDATGIIVDNSTLTGQYFDIIPNGN